MRRAQTTSWIGTAGLLLGVLATFQINADEKTAIDAKTIRDLGTDVLEEDRSQLERMLYEDSRARLREANRRETRAWREIKNRDQWETYRDRRIQSLRDSLGRSSTVPKPLPVKVTGTLKGEGYRIENLVYETRPGLWVTANLYQPEKPKESMPGIIICHSHHNPKTQSELQDMGVMWARAGCLVLVPDQLGHGERGQHGFRKAEDYDDSFRVSRQDYYFRYNLALQLHLVGESLIGWMAWDMMRGVDLLLSRPGVDPKRILLLGAVAGGGDPAAVTAALDRRITGVVPFNFGGPQPETGALGADAEDAFNYAGSGSWESTRNLKDSARDGFLPWVIVGAAAPRGLVYAHEFRWDQDRDPVWKRLNAIYGFYEAGERISWVKGYGTVRMSSNEASHCNNIGPVHRKGIHQAFKSWFNIPIPDEEFRERRSASELNCLNANVKQTPVHQLAGRLATDRLDSTQRRLEGLPAKKRRERLCSLLMEKLGDVDPYAAKIANHKTETKAGVRIEKFVLTGEREIRLPVLLMIPDAPGDNKNPVVVMLAQSGKAELLRERAEAVSALLNAGVAVCLPDLRGTGETRPGDGRARQSWATSLSATELMLGQTMLGSRLKDLRSLMAHLRTRKELNSKRIAVWGDSLAAVNPADRNVNVPRGIDNYPSQAEPGGPLLALFAGVFEDELAAVVLARGGLVSWRSILESPFTYVPHDAVVPGLLEVADLNDITESFAPKPLWISGLVDGRNKSINEQTARTNYARTKVRYQESGSTENFQLSAKEKSPQADIVPWLIKRLNTEAR